MSKKKKKEDYEEKIKKLEAKVREFEKEKEEPSVVEGVVSQFIPGLGGIIKTLEKSSPEFRRRIAETDAKIKHRLETGWTSKPKVEYSIYARQLVPEEEFKPRRIEKPRKEVEAPAVEREPIVDIFENEYISVIAELPGVEEKDIETKIVDDKLEISAKKYRKTIKLPSIPKSIVEKTYKNGILQIKMERR
ncbi:MAG: hypothetical protein QMC80_06575 [Thermoplasmatales archaeon]|nr:hypothetical protein [Thermoplasmatales archaeon]